MTGTQPSGVGAPGATTFASVLCGIRGSRVDAEIVRQAATLLEAGGRLHLVAVAWEVGFGPSAAALLNRSHAKSALAEARAEARRCGVDASVEVVDADAPADALLAAAGDHDLLAIGPSGAGRAQGIAVGRTASVVLHRAAMPVLVARRPAAGRAFPATVLLAVDGTPSSRAATRVAARIAGRHGSHVAIVSPPERDEMHRHALAEDAAAIREATGRDPVLLDEHGSAVRAIVAAARTWEASLLVLGSRGLHGVAALRSVSERVAHGAPCSVLVVR